MKASVRAQMSQSLNLTPQLLQSIRLLQLTAPQLEMELRQALDRNPMLELDEGDEAGETDADSREAASDEASFEASAWDELPEPQFLSGMSGGVTVGDDDATARIADGEFSDWRLRLLKELRLDWSAGDLLIAAWWLDRTADSGLLEGELATLTAEGAAELGVDAKAMEIVRLRLLHGDWAGLCAVDACECLVAQLHRLPACGERDLAGRIVRDHLATLARHDGRALADALDCSVEAANAAVALILSLDACPVPEPSIRDDDHVVPDVVVRKLGGQWRVNLNGRTLPKVRISAHCESGLSGASGDVSALRGLLDEARWLVRGIAMRNDTLLRTTQVLVERQRAFLDQGEEAIAPLTLREVADAIGMHESTVSRITTGKYIQTPRGTFELKRLFAVRLEGADVSGAAVKAMVKRLIDAELPHAPLADETIAGLLARQGVRIARRTVAKYRDQLDIAPARARQRPVAAYAAR
ncbi:RNA polymerase sigma-54 factor [Lysobacter sp. TY2-98]|uniref:RNA polymerase factor sigma-54 n=1 Tax=Lysobacter sp. TY2-98 TaxID=2290922 RepID=UPI000E1FB8AE|nr:RNA polymerase factor sigma-54 [Lysobacter sp. TY2-98]AXK71279.1 RNA polymerase sigma-54 factor [Lysobacter sp. TY2-98]